ncbi:MAG TPA: bifunctional DNA-formamidopyrimidine glycosylase/DNA-(apurinic or apyrimidinic site) lyase [Candidatus Aminicenantes bacterium]|nr:bifunctional DNA-formamidopyrimidine glycosylase/DNA-(apurinic or apyrimidinic site) lyase [Candidatus Aminicenantes bacterium]
MPELPEVETIVRELAPRLRGRIWLGVESHWSRTAPDAAAMAGLAGQRVRRVFRRGKYICLEFEGGAVVTVHLRMSGRLSFAGEAEPAKHVRLEFRLEGVSPLLLVDPRKFARVRLVAPGSPLLPELGPEPRDEETVRGVLAGVTSRRGAKAVLLDQTVLAGIGNIYADEILFAAGIHPLRSLPSLTPAQRERLARAVVAVLEEGIAHGGTTLSDYYTPSGQPGRHAGHVQVYGRDGKACFRCGAIIARTVAGGRTTRFCPRCQRLAGEEPPSPCSPVKKSNPM